jgi:hypothetical protein
MIRCNEAVGKQRLFSSDQICSIVSFLVAQRVDGGAGCTHVPGFWSLKGVRDTVLTLMALERGIGCLGDTPEGLK